MLLRRAVTAAGLAVALIGAGAGTAFAANDDGLLGGLTGTVEETGNNVQSPAQPGGGNGDDVMDTIDEATGGATKDVREAAEDVTGGAGGAPGGNVRVPTQNGGDDALVDAEGACADLASESGPPCESDTLGSETVNACVEDDGGAVSDLAGGNDGVAETVGLNCTRTTGGAMPAPGGSVGGGSPSGGFMPAPEDGATAAPARAVAQQPTFAG